MLVTSWLGSSLKTNLVFWSQVESEAKSTSLEHLAEIRMELQMFKLHLNITFVLINVD